MLFAAGTGAVQFGIPAREREMGFLRLGGERGGQVAQMRFHHGAAVFGQSIKPVHFGVSDATVIDEIRFTWLTGITEAIYNVPVNQLLQFKEGTGVVVEEQLGGPNGHRYFKNY